MLDYAVKLTVAPSSVGEGNVEALRQQGFEDRDILDIVYVICRIILTTAWPTRRESKATTSLVRRYRNRETSLAVHVRRFHDQADGA